MRLIHEAERLLIAGNPTCSHGAPLIQAMYTSKPNNSGFRIGPSLRRVQLHEEVPGPLGLPLYHRLYRLLG